MDQHRIYQTSFASVYPLYIAKAARKQRTKAEVDAIISWLTGYDETALRAVLENEVNIEMFFSNAPQLNPARKQITGVICGVRVEDIREPLMQEIRYLDKLIDELAKGKKLDTILRKS